MRVPLFIIGCAIVISGILTGYWHLDMRTSDLEVKTRCLDNIVQLDTVGQIPDNTEVRWLND